MFGYLRSMDDSIHCSEVKVELEKIHKVGTLYLRGYLI